jgi:hypothetical protein
MRSMTYPCNNTQPLRRYSIIPIFQYSNIPITPGAPLETVEPVSILASAARRLTVPENAGRRHAG